jgi:hypothetical protein
LQHLTQWIYRLPWKYKTRNVFLLKITLWKVLTNYTSRNTHFKLKSNLSFHPVVWTGVDLELREDVVHQLQRRHQPCLLVNRSTQTVTVAMSNSSSNANCPNNQQQQQQLPIAKLSATCHIINSSSNGPISISTSQQNQQIKDVQL